MATLSVLDSTWCPPRRSTAVRSAVTANDAVIRESMLSSDDLPRVDVLVSAHMYSLLSLVGCSV
ncbi:MAG: hypothetical protein CSA84_01145 [Actinomycetales bacterium]|nr:MAG: hypothetical protein CSA84_01145 [Actinomycetales bacterium]